MSIHKTNNTTNIRMSGLISDLIVAKENKSDFCARLSHLFTYNMEPPNFLVHQFPQLKGFENSHCSRDLVSARWDVPSFSLGISRITIIILWFSLIPAYYILLKVMEVRNPSGFQIFLKFLLKINFFRSVSYMRICLAYKSCYFNWTIDRFQFNCHLLYFSFYTQYFQ